MGWKVEPGWGETARFKCHKCGNLAQVRTDATWCTSVKLKCESCNKYMEMYSAVADVVHITITDDTDDQRERSDDR